MRVVGLDLSLTHTGICRVDIVDGQVTDEDIRCSSVTSKPGTSKDYPAISERIRKIADAIDEVAQWADLVVMEGPAFASRNGQTHSRYWLWGRVYDNCAGAGIPVTVVAPAQRARYITGKGNAAKDMVLAATLKRWPDVNVSGNDEADALVLAAIGCRKAGFPIDQVPKGNWEPVLAKV